MTWTETLSKTERRAQIKEYIINRFKEIYSYSENPLEFTISDGSKMKVVSLGGTHFDSLVMSYKSDYDDDDGDVYHIDDYDSPESLFTAMLEETQR